MGSSPLPKPFESEDFGPATDQAQAGDHFASPANQRNSNVVPLAESDRSATFCRGTHGTGHDTAQQSLKRQPLFLDQDENLTPAFEEVSHSGEDVYRVGEWIAQTSPCIIRGIKHQPQILAIRYPRGSKRRFFTYRGGELIRVETVLSDQSKTRVLYNKDLPSGAWSMTLDGINAWLPGEVSISDNGVFHIQVDDAGRCRKEYPDGTTSVDMACTAHHEQSRRVARALMEPDFGFADDDPIPAYSQRTVLELLSAVSHDLRSPLTSVQGLLTLLSAGAFGDIPEKARARIANVEIDLSRLTRLINELLDAEMLVSGKLLMRKELIDVQDLFEAAIGSLSGMALQNRINLLVVKSNLQLCADRDRLVRVLVNIVANAIKYSPKGSTVVLSAECDGEHVFLRVKDSGKGIPALHQKAIFERHHQVVDSDWSEKGGAGLGLAISRSIVEAHGGEIGVESQAGLGSTFWVSLPANARL